MVSKFTSAGAPLPDGHYVRASDYDAALSKIEALKLGYEQVLRTLDLGHFMRMITSAKKHDLEGNLAEHRAALAAVEGAEKT